MTKLVNSINNGGGGRNKNLDLTNFTAVVTTDMSAVIGQLVYMSLGSILVPKETMGEIMEEIGLPIDLMPNRYNVVDAFFSATADLSTKTNTSDGRLIKVYVRDNAKDKKGAIVSRELVKEIVGMTNTYQQIGKFVFDQEKQEMTADINTYDGDLEASFLQGMVDKAFELYELYKVSYGRSSVETIIENFLKTLDVSKVEMHGKLYFVPNYRMEETIKLELFATKLNENNQLKNFNVNYSPIVVNAIPVINEEKQCDNFKRDFYSTVGKEIEEYQKRLANFIENGSTSKAVIDRWIEKIRKLQEKKKNYEGVFNQSLDALNDQFAIIESQTVELQLRAKNGNIQAQTSSSKPIVGQTYISCMAS